jgi:hypothetical protein
MLSDSRISYWLKCQRIQNFGDMLSEVLFETLTAGRDLCDRAAIGAVEEFDIIHLIGSCIATDSIKKDLEYVRATGGKRIAFWGCGLRSGEMISQDLLEHCAFRGVRGPLTREWLGLPDSTPLGDPALLIPYIYSPRPNLDVADRYVCVPHFNETLPNDTLRRMSGCDIILRPNLPNSIEHVHKFIDSIVAARFVLAGALHAAIISYAYGRPFAYFDSGFVDIPFKWADFAASINMPCCFVRNLQEGLRVFEWQSNGCRMPPLTDLLREAPFNPPGDLLRKVAAGTASCERVLSLPSSLHRRDVIDDVISAAMENSDFIFLPSPDDVTNSPPSAHIAYCSTVADDKARIVLRLCGGEAGAPSSGTTGGYSIRTTTAFENAASGREILIRIAARASMESGEGRIGVAYATNEVGNSGWRWFDVARDWAVYEVKYSVPPMRVGNGDFIGLLPGGSSIEVAVVTAAVVSPGCEPYPAFG